MKANEYKQMFELEDSNWWFVGKRAFIEAMLSQAKLPSQAKILDIGCGTGGATKLLQKYGEVVGVEKNRVAIRMARSRGLKVLEGSANNIKLPSESVDLVTIFDVLYHKGVDDSKAISEAKRVLKKGGYLLITDCAGPWLYSKHDVVMQARQRYTKNELKRKVKSSGMSIVRASYIFMSTYPLFVVQRLFMKIAFKGRAKIKTNEVINSSFMKIVKLESKILPRFNLPFGSSIIVLSRK